MTWVMVDVEADGPIPGDYSMIAIGAVVIGTYHKPVGETFHGLIKPISAKWVPEALAVSGYTREETEGFGVPEVVMYDFDEWLRHYAPKPKFIADNNGFDWQFVNWYFHHFLGRNPFGFSSSNLGSLYKGMVKSMRENFKHLRKTKHTHNPVDDATGNAEAFVFMVEKMGLRI